MELILGEVPDRLVHVEEAGAAEDAAVPAVHRVAGDRERAVVERLGVVVELRQVDVVHPAHALATRAHATLDGEGLAHGLGVALLDGDGSASPDRGDVEREGLRRADMRLPESAEEDAQQRVGVGDGTDRRARVGSHPLLVDDDRGRQPVQDVDLGPRQRRHETLHEGAVSLVDQPLRFRSDGAENQ
ncbi:hypothetical protein D3C87_1080690 [compost metagenome]